jgi:hypothetical protein
MLLNLLLVMTSIGFSGGPFVLLRSKILSKLAALADLRTKVIEDPDGQAESGGEAEEEQLRVADAQVVIHLACVQGAHTGEEVTRKPVTTGGGCRVLPIGSNHVVDGSLQINELGSDSIFTITYKVDAVVGSSDQYREDNNATPVEWRARGDKSTSQKAEREEDNLEKEPPETALRGQNLTSSTSLCVAPHHREEREVGEDVAQRKWDESKTVLDRCKSPLRKHISVTLKEREDKRISETTKERQEEDDGFEY